MKKIFIAAKSEQICDSIAQNLSDEIECEIFSLTSGKEARNADLSGFDTVIVSTPLEDEFGLDLLAEIHGKCAASLVVLTKKELESEVQSRIKFTGAFVVGRPCSKNMLLQAIRLAEVANENFTMLKEENRRLSQRIDDLKLINRAKNCLMQYLNLTEEQAHRHLQKQAMDLRITQKAAAEQVLKTYDKI